MTDCKDQVMFLRQDRFKNANIFAHKRDGNACACAGTEAASERPVQHSAAPLRRRQTAAHPSASFLLSSRSVAQPRRRNVCQTGLLPAGAKQDGVGGSGAVPEPDAGGLRSLRIRVVSVCV